MGSQQMHRLTVSTFFTSIHQSCMNKTAHPIKTIVQPRCMFQTRVWKFLQESCCHHALGPSHSALFQLLTKPIMEIDLSLLPIQNREGADCCIVEQPGASNTKTQTRFHRIPWHLIGRRLCQRSWARHHTKEMVLSYASVAHTVYFC